MTESYEKPHTFLDLLHDHGLKRKSYADSAAIEHELTKLGPHLMGLFLDHFQSLGLEYITIADIEAAKKLFCRPDVDSYH